MGIPEDGDGKGTKGYGVTGITDGPGSVRTLILEVVRCTEEGRVELLLSEEDKLAEVDVDVTEGDNECGEWVDNRRGKGVDGDDDGDAPRFVDGKEDEGAADAGAAAKKTRTVKDHMEMQWGHPVD
jgi:hypothetical protein